MVSLVHHATASLFCTKEEASRMRKILAGMLPQGIEIDEHVIEPELEGGVFTKELVELKAKITSQKEIKDLYSKILKGLDSYDLDRIKGHLGQYVDDECNLYLRIGKGEAESGSMVIESKDPIHFTFKLAAYPARRQNALESAHKLIEDGLL